MTLLGYLTLITITLGVLLLIQGGRTVARAWRDREVWDDEPAAEAYPAARTAAFPAARMLPSAEARTAMLSALCDEPDLPPGENMVTAAAVSAPVQPADNTDQFTDWHWIDGELLAPESLTERLADDDWLRQLLAPVSV